MKQFLGILFLLLATALNGHGQTTGWLNTKIMGADTVVLVSHHCFQCMDLGVDRKGRPIQPPKLLLKGKPNYQAFLKRRTITPLQRSALSKILVRPFRDTVTITAQCFEPHHTIFLLKNGRTSFIDICFECRQFRPSDDLVTKLDDFDNRKWMELKKFFDNLGLAYQFR